VLDALRNDPQLDKADIPAELRPLFVEESRTQNKPAPVVLSTQNNLRQQNAVSQQRPDAVESRPRAPQTAESALREFTNSVQRPHRKTA